MTKLNEIIEKIEKARGNSKSVDFYNKGKNVQGRKVLFIILSTSTKQTINNKPVFLTEESVKGLENDLLNYFIENNWTILKNGLLDLNISLQQEKVATEKELRNEYLGTQIF